LSHKYKRTRLPQFHITNILKMDQTQTDFDTNTEENKELPGTLLESNFNTQRYLSHHHISHEHKHSLSYTSPALIEVCFIANFFFLN